MKHKFGQKSGKLVAFASEKVIPISSEAKYSGQNMRWTEIKTDSGKTVGTNYVVHYSDRKLPAFLPQETCFFHDFGKDGKLWKSPSEFVYLLEIPEGTQVDVYGTEVRLCLDEKMKIIDITSEFFPDDSKKGYLGREGDLKGINIGRDVSYY